MAARLAIGLQLLALAACLPAAYHTSVQSLQDLRFSDQDFPPTKVDWFPVPLDHFSFNSDVQTRVRYVTYEGFSTPNGPTLFYCGNEGDIMDFYNASGFMFEVAQQLGALVVFVEHRYYGESLPFGDESYSGQNLVYLTVEQAMADFALFISTARDKGLAEINPDTTILFGGSYGGMIAAWMRVKYPHLSIGALASGAPIDLYPGQSKQPSFYQATLYTFNTYGVPVRGQQCGDVLDRAITTVSRYFEISPAKLQGIFRTCRPLESQRSLDQLVFYIKGALATLAMLDYPYAASFVTPMPGHPVRVACGLLGTFDDSDEGVLDGLNAAVNVFVNYTGDLPCHAVHLEVVGGAPANKPSQSANGLGDITAPWNYQACTQLILEPLTTNGFGFYPEDDTQIGTVSEWCKSYFNNSNLFIDEQGIRISTGGNITRALSNIFLNDCDKDPWRTGGLIAHQHPDALTELPNGVLVFLATECGHHQDLRSWSPLDSPGVVKARTLELQAFRKWLNL